MAETGSLPPPSPSTGLCLRALRSPHWRPFLKMFLHPSDDIAIRKDCYPHSSPCGHDWGLGVGSPTFSAVWMLERALEAEGAALSQACCMTLSRSLGLPRLLSCSVEWGANDYPRGLSEE